MKRIVLTGGGTAGHVTPNIALIPALQEAGYEIAYVGSYEGMERKLIEDIGIPYTGVATGKFRRYFDPKNFSDPFRVLKGYREAKAYLKKYRPDVVFSKGGFVSVPVVRAAAKLKIPCVIHESDVTPGLANKLCIPVASKVCCNFPETLPLIPGDKAVLTGTPIRRELSDGDAAKGRELCGFNDRKPVLMIIGGSQGASAVNQAVRDALPRLLERFQVVHLCGKDKMDNLLLTVDGYKQFEYVTTDLKDIFAAADIVISRAGANAICEILSLKKPNILVPLPTGRGDQILNAKSFKEQGFSVVIDQEDLTTNYLLEQVNALYENRQSYIDAMSRSNQTDSIGEIVKIIESLAKNA
jgi:UDP-N-acetylglucosamine--N-acetylmuramyl-(pentapeptide) pyrophosphoryl-undecaprenol N-acetylglucosamine transferase